MAGTLKERTLALMQGVGVTSRVATSGWRRRLPILRYHGIARFHDHLWDPRLYILKSQSLPSTVYLATLSPPERGHSVRVRCTVRLKTNTSYVPDL